jgi:glycine betaine catabolism A
MDGVSDYIWSMRITPVDAQHSAVDTTWLVDGKAVEGKDYQVDRLAEFWRITGGQDWKLCENNQRGIDSSSYTQGPYAPTETDVLTFDKWCIDSFRKYLRSKAAG